MPNDLPDRLRFSRAVYTADPAAAVPPAERLVKVGLDAEGWTVYGDPAQLNSRKRVFLLDAAGRPRAYVRPDLPRGVSVAAIVREALGDRLDDERAIVLRAILSRKQLVLIDGTRLGLRGAKLDELLRQLNGHDWQTVPSALEKRALAHWEVVGTALQTHPYVRRLADPQFGAVARVGSTGATVSQRTRDPVDLGQELVAYVAPKRVPRDFQQLASHPQTGQPAALCYLTVARLGPGEAEVRPVFPELLAALEPGCPVDFAFYTST